MRLRPQGESGQLVATLSAYEKYYTDDAWVWEHMALTRARPILGEAGFRTRIEAAIRDILIRPRDPDTLFAGVSDMRRRLDRERPARSDWHVKYLRGGLVDLEFLAQSLQLRHAHEHPEVLAPNTQAAFAALARAGVLAQARADFLIEATRLMRRVQGLLRLTAGAAFDESAAPAGVKEQLARACGCPDFEALRAHLLATAGEVHHIFGELIEQPAAAAAAASANSEKETRA
jgi:glutamate-ammonia-ligase adenylyltransferase